MPQPLRKWDRELNFGPEAADREPLLTAAIVKVSIEWAHIETGLGLLLAAALHTSAYAGIRMYLALTGTAAQEAAVSAALAANMPKNVTDAYQELIPDVRKRARERNAIVHGIWGWSPALPGRLVNCPIDNMVRDVSDALWRRRMQPAVMEDSGPSKEFLAACMIYQVKDLEDIIHRMHSVQKELDDLTRTAKHISVARDVLARLPKPARSVAEGAPPSGRKTPKSPA